MTLEILSPSTARLDLGRKREIYAESGVIEMWVVVPKTQTVEIFRFREDSANPVAVLRPGDMVASSIFPGLELAVADVFRD